MRVEKGHEGEGGGRSVAGGGRGENGGKGGRTKEENFACALLGRETRGWEEERSTPVHPLRKYYIIHNIMFSS